MTKADNDNTKSLKSQDTQLEISKIYAFCQKIQQGTSGPGESPVEVISIFENTSKFLILKSIFPLKVAATLLSGSRKPSWTIVRG